VVPGGGWARLVWLGGVADDRACEERGLSVWLCHGYIETGITTYHMCTSAVLFPVNHCPVDFIVNGWFEAWAAVLCLLPAIVVVVYTSAL